ncbi:merozoite surface protein 7 (MSP7) [Plasmodium vivax North Korean]|uniref:Merozoite surface protein 7 (MSP7) n=1 Tax=Plasmodium vivax North Korean TaxID=1035514 RepID=A0A0J9TS97_PLAVI|nr:merozoite surface protein 7 (MSP7) [Plasmodium vivax North Korean]
MKGVTGPICCLFLFLFSCASSEKLGVQKKKKNLEQDATHALMKKLESLYKLSATDNSEIFNKEIESLKKQIDQLHQHGGENEGESLGHLLESEAANESAKKTIFGVDEDDLDNYDADFIGQSKGKIKGQADTDNQAQRTADVAAQPGGVLPSAGAQSRDTARPEATDRPNGVVERGFVDTRTLQNVGDNGQPTVDTLADETFQAEFDNFVHGLYGFAKRHNYLSEARMKDADRYTNLLKNAISLMYTI